MNSHFNIWPATIKSYVFRNVSIHPTALFIEARSLRKRQIHTQNVKPFWETRSQRENFQHNKNIRVLPLIIF